MPKVLACVGMGMEDYRCPCRIERWRVSCCDRDLQLASSLMPVMVMGWPLSTAWFFAESHAAMSTLTAQCARAVCVEKPMGKRGTLVGVGSTPSREVSGRRCEGRGCWGEDSLI